MNVIRHGDVNLIPATVDVSKLTRVKTNGKYILARGEATNSVHEISTVNPDSLEIYTDEAGTVYVRVLEDAQITHTSDHETITMPSNPRIVYRQVQEREVDNYADVTRKVVD